MKDILFEFINAPLKTLKIYGFKFLFVCFRYYMMSSLKIFGIRKLVIKTPFGFKIMLNFDDPLGLKMASGVYEFEHVLILNKLFQNLPLKKFTMVDGGANIGYFSLPFSNKFFVYSFEPNPFTFSVLLDNIKKITLIQ